MINAFFHEDLVITIIIFKWFSYVLDKVQIGRAVKNSPKLDQRSHGALYRQLLNL